MEDTQHKEVYNVVKAIDDLDLGDWFIQQPLLKSYIFWNHENKHKIMNHPNVLCDMHSSSSFACTLKYAHKHYFFLK